MIEGLDRGAFVLVLVVVCLFILVVIIVWGSQARLINLYQAAQEEFTSMSDDNVNTRRKVIKQFFVQAEDEDEAGEETGKREEFSKAVVKVKTRPTRVL